MNYLNLTPHLIRLNDGREFAPSGLVARVSASYVEAGPDMFKAVFGEVQGLPAAVEGVMLIVSGMVAQAVSRKDVVSPATGHPLVVRKDGQVFSVPGFIQG